MPLDVLISQRSSTKLDVTERDRAPLRDRLPHPLRDRFALVGISSGSGFHFGDGSDQLGAFALVGDAEDDGASGVNPGDAC